MARPKGSKNKTEVTAEPVAFNYEDSDTLYQQVMSNGAVAPVFKDPEPEVQVQAIMTSPTLEAAVVNHPTISTLFLVEGLVRLDRPGQVGAPPIQAEQRRIVSASNIDEALAKFTTYFQRMSNANERYTVVRAGASETIL